MAEDFEASVEEGLRLSKRIFFGKDRAMVAPPKPPTSMDRSYVPTSPMMYAVISDPTIVDNPDMPSYQPHVHGRCDPPALVPLQMNNVSLEVDCYLDTAFVTMTGSWRLHCVMVSRSCDCRVVVPMGEQGSLLGVEVELPMKSYSTRLNAMDNESDTQKISKIGDGGFLKPHIFTLTIPEIEGGTNFSVKVRWSQKLSYRDGHFTLTIPFNFPGYVAPAGKMISKHEKIHLNVNSSPEAEVLCKMKSHPLKERQRQVEKLPFTYEADVLSWSSHDFVFKYSISSSHTFGGVLLNPPSSLDVDHRDMFCCYFFPGKPSSRKVFRREVVFVVDISGSMSGQPLDNTKNALFSALAKLGPEDLFNVIAFNGETYLFSSSLEPATAEAIEKVTQWIIMNFVAGGGTNILLPLNQAIEMLSHSRNCMPIIFLITDGAVEDEKQICDTMKNQLTSKKEVSPRIYTLGIGTFCNHYFLRMLAILGRGHHAAAGSVDLIEDCMGGLFARASSIFLANISFDNLEEIDDVEVFPSQIPDFSSESPFIISGRYQRKFPETLRVSGILQDMSKFSLDLKVQGAKEIPLRKIVAKQEIDLLTAQAWYSESTELEEKIAKMSVQYAIISEYTGMSLLETEKEKKGPETTFLQMVKSSKVHNIEPHDPKPQNIFTLDNFGLGFGDLTATTENLPPGYTGPKAPPDSADVFVKSASSCCSRLCCHCSCCTLCMRVRVNDQLALACTQLCGAFACFGCFTCCSACCNGQDH